MIGHAIAAAFRWLKDGFTKNLAMKIGAVVFAFMLWGYVVTFNNPQRIKTLPDVPVTYVGADQMRDSGLTSSVPLYDALNTVNVSVQVNSEYLSATTSDLVQSTVDLTGITQPGEYTLPVRSTTQANFITITTTTPANVTLTIEESMAKQVPVDVQLEGIQQEDLYYGVPRLSQSTVEVSGARSAIEQVARAVCTVDIANLDQTTTATHTLHLVDQEGDEISSALFADVPSVIVEVPIYPKRTLALDPDRIAAEITGVPEGYEVSNVTVVPQSVDIAGPRAAIDAVQSITTEPITLDGTTQESITIDDVALVLPDEVYKAIPSTIEVHVTLSMLRADKSYAGVAVGVKNLEEGYTAVLQPSAVDVTVTGAQNAVARVTSDQIRPFVDLTGMGPGAHRAEIKFENEADLGVTLTPTVRSVAVVIRGPQAEGAG